MPSSRIAPLEFSAVPLWGKLLFSPMPWVGKWLQRFALAQLTKSVQTADLAAASLLGMALDHPRTAQWVSDIRQILSGGLSSAIIDQLWEDWSSSRSPSLAAWLIQNNLTARPQSPAWLISQVVLNRTGTLKSAAPARVASLVALCSDPDPHIAATALEALSTFSLSESRDELVRLWSQSRFPFLWQIIRSSGYVPAAPTRAQVLYFLKAGDTENVLHASAALVPDLVACLTDIDPDIANQACACLPLLQEENATNALAEIWRRERDPQLKEILRKGGLLATHPYELRLLTALISRPELAAQSALAGIPTLIQAVRDPDPQIAAAARSALLNLTQLQTQAELCQYAVEQNDADAFSLALQAGFRPQLPPQRALFVFLAGLWPEYDQLDFDHRLLQMVYASAPAPLRQRIALQIQRSGLTTYLDILAGPDMRSQAGRLSTEENDLFAQLLLENREWQRLWAYLQTFSLPWSIRILKAMRSAKWQPDQPAECAEFEQLSQLSEHLSPPTCASLTKLLPAALQGATVKVQGRVNDVCFVPHQPLIGIGTGLRKLVLWNFQEAAIKQIRQGFNHSISRVACASSDLLLCGVRANTDAACLIYGWQGDDAFVLPGHVGAVTALLPIDETSLVSTGRDGQIIHWNLITRQETHRQTVAEWPRSALLLPGRNQIALLHTSLSVLQLPTLAEVPIPPFWIKNGSGTQRSVAQCAFFPPDQPGFLIGQRNGQVIQCTTSHNGRKTVLQALLREPAPVIEMAYLSRHKILAIALQTGEIQFYRWPGLRLIGSVSTSAKNLTSLQISDDESFMATGTSDSSMVLWDLRIQDLPDILEQPLAKATPDHLVAVSSLLRHAPALTAPFRQSLELLAALLVRRFRFDIQVDDLPQIQPGEFDILLD